MAHGDGPPGGEGELSGGAPVVAVVGAVPAVVPVPVVAAPAPSPAVVVIPAVDFPPEDKSAHPSVGESAAASDAASSSASASQVEEGGVATADRAALCVHFSSTRNIQHLYAPDDESDESSDEAASNAGNASEEVVGASQARDELQALLPPSQLNSDRSCCCPGGSAESFMLRGGLGGFVVAILWLILEGSLLLPRYPAYSLMNRLTYWLLLAGASFGTAQGVTDGLLLPLMVSLLILAAAFAGRVIGARQDRAKAQTTPRLSDEENQEEHDSGPPSPQARCCLL